MELVNLKKYYPCLYAKDTLIEVSDEVAEALLFMQRQENASIRRRYYHRAFFSLDCEDGIENDRIGEAVPSPEEICIRREDKQLLLITVNHLHEAMACLSPAQFRNRHHAEIGADINSNREILAFVVCHSNPSFLRLLQDVLPNRHDTA